MICAPFANQNIGVMKKIFYLLVFGFTFCVFNSGFCQMPPAEWQHYYGGTVGEEATSVQQTNDGGYIIGGNSQSSDGDVTGHHGENDCWIVKTDSSGNLQWEKSLGGSYDDYSISVKQIRDGGYIVLCKTSSNDGDVTVLKGYQNFWIVKLSSSGNIEWQKTFGGSYYDTPVAIEQTIDNGFIAAGFTQSNDSDVSGNHGGKDYWIVKIDSIGNLQWQKCYGGSLDDEAYDICQVTDGSYVVVGHSNSDDGDVLNADTSWGCSWIIKLDSIGNLVSQRVFNISPGGVPDSMKYVSNVTPTLNNGVVVAGSYSFRPGGVQGRYIYTEKFDSALNTVWDKNYGSHEYQYQYASCGDIQPTNDGGYVISAWFDDWVRYDIIKIDNAGNYDWDTSFCCSMIGYAYTKQTTDGGYIFANHWAGNADNYWVIKFGYNTTLVNENTILNSDLAANLTIHSLTLSFTSLESANLRLAVTDITGRIILTQPITATPGINKKEIPVGNIAQGVYVITLSGAGGMVSGKVVKE